MRELIMTGGPWTDEERIEIIHYCASDVEALQRLLSAMLPSVASSRTRFGHALLSGRYMVATGIMENHGIPIDVGLLKRLQNHWEAIRSRLINVVDADFGVYVDGSFSKAKFESYLATNGIPWPRHATGRLELREDTFRQRAKAFPAVASLHELHYTLSKLRLGTLQIGPDERNRALC